MDYIRLKVAIITIISVELVVNSILQVRYVFKVTDAIIFIW